MHSHSRRTPTCMHGQLSEMNTCVTVCWHAVNLLKASGCACAPLVLLQL